MPLAYLDPSAFLKLVLIEDESAALTRWLESWPRRTSSRLLRLEALRAIRRHRPDLVAGMRGPLSGVGLIGISEDILEVAATLEPSVLGSLDAIHVATAMALGAELGALVTYDRRMIETARQLGLPVASPA